MFKECAVSRDEKETEPANTDGKKPAWVMENCLRNRGKPNVSNGQGVYFKECDSGVKAVSAAVSESKVILQSPKKKVAEAIAKRISKVVPKTKVPKDAFKADFSHEGEVAEPPRGGAEMAAGCVLAGFGTEFEA